MMSDQAPRFDASHRRRLTIGIVVLLLGGAVAAAATYAAYREQKRERAAIALRIRQDAAAFEAAASDPYAIPIIRGDNGSLSMTSWDAVPSPSAVVAFVRLTQVVTDDATIRPNGEVIGPGSQHTMPCEGCRTIGVSVESLADWDAGFTTPRIRPRPPLSDEIRSRGQSSTHSPDDIPRWQSRSGSWVLDYQLPLDRLAITVPIDVSLSETTGRTTRTQTLRIDFPPVPLPPVAASNAADAPTEPM